MEGHYLLAYTLYGKHFKHGFKSCYTHFETLEDMENFIDLHGLECSCIRYKKIIVEYKE